MMFVLVNPVSTGKALATAFREEGAECLHLYDASLRHAYDADSSPHTMVHEDLAKTLGVLKGLRPTAVIAASEYGVLLADALAAKLGLPHHRPEQAAARRDKELMVRALEQAGVPAARTGSVRDEAELIELLARWGGHPVMVKPRDSAGSDGCTISPDRETALAAFRAIVDRRNLMGEVNHDVLVQEFLTGTQYIVNTVSIGGRHLVSEVYAERIDHIDGAPVLRHIISRPQLDAAEAELVAYVLKCLDALGIQEGAAHTEVMLTPAGPRLVEVNSRVMGPSLAPDPYHAAFGYSHQHLVVERFLRPEEFALRLELPYTAARTVAKVFLRSDRPGVLLAVDGARILRRLPGFHSIDRLPAIGQPILDRYLTTGASGIAYLVHEDKHLLLNSLGVIHDLEDSGALYRLAEQS
ncbi:ATP-grasp domain-containing protein [Peterkaempfera bronchialis]|uniref:ATP-grasp domain-containing protein n=1 Tax=Peterkaempfera bronchialis TaxID=2126346 RepID=A0A345SST6_9ACTN|nr:ATP-grasp domain-containing protein [Peterkaempfera bronchialis]AXI76791.1 ATP-grasp domain-containing protein [Peterkaempfera bronchialis]